jgi:hypothetical protein
MMIYPFPTRPTATKTKSTTRFITTATLSGMNRNTSTMDDDSDDHTILSAAQVLMSLAPTSLSKHGIDGGTIVQSSSTSPLLQSSGTHHNDHHKITMNMNAAAATTPTTPTIHYYVTPTSTYTVNTVSINEFPKILNVPQRSRTRNDGNDSSCASSLHDGLDDDHSHASSTSSSTSSSSSSLMQRQGTTTTTAKRNPQHRRHDTTIICPPCTASPNDTVAPMIVVPDRTNHAMKMKNIPNKVNRKKKKKKMIPGKISSLFQGPPSTGDVSMVPTTTSPTTQTYYEGSISLRLKEDELSLSPLHCFMRQYCVEAFTASSEEVTTPRYGKSHGRSISIGQVGIQCVFCKNRPYWLRQERAVCFPSTLKNIYHSIETWQRRHSIVCTDIPTWAKDSMTKLMGKSRSGAGGRRQYWEESASQLGMIDTPTGIRFLCPPGTPVVSIENLKKNPNIGTSSNNTVCTDEETTFMSTNTTTMEGVNSTTTTGVVEENDPSSTTLIGGEPVVEDYDKELVTDFLFTLLNQMETCYFSEQDRVGGRSKVKDCSIGYPGLQCKHCGGKAGFGRYYPISIQALTSANSDRNIYNHVDKCRRCPPQIRSLLEKHLTEQSMAKNRRGNRKEFFQRVWERMHGPPSKSIEPKGANVSLSTDHSIERNITNHDTNMDVDETKESSSSSASYLKHIVYKQRPQYGEQLMNINNGPMQVVCRSNNNNVNRKQQQQEQQEQQRQLQNHSSNVCTQYKPIQSQLVPTRQVLPTQFDKHSYEQLILQEIQKRFQAHPELYQPHLRQIQNHHSSMSSSSSSTRNDTYPQQQQQQQLPTVIASSASSSFPSFYHHH